MKLTYQLKIDGNPLERIKDTEYVIYTMVNGRLFDVFTIYETVNHPLERLPFWWEREDYSEQLDWHANNEADRHGH